MSGHLHGGHAGLQLHAPFGGRVVNLPAGLRWNDFQKYYRGHPNGSTAERWQEYQQLHAAKAAAQKAAAEARPEGGAEKRNAVWVAPRPITPTKRLVTDVADRLWDRKQSSDYRQWTRPDPAQKRQRSAGQMVLERWGPAWKADPGSAAVQPAYINRPVLQPVTKLMGGARGTRTHYNSVGEQVAFSAGGVDSDDHPLLQAENQAATDPTGAQQPAAEQPAEGAPAATAASDPRSDLSAAPAPPSAAHTARAAGEVQGGTYIVTQPELGKDSG